MKEFLRVIALFLCFLTLPVSAEVWIIAIDPGHGGKDPGAIGRNLGIYEKNVTLSIARELKALLDKDPNFRGVLTRRSDYFISVPERSEIARKNKANFLISIHADSSESSTLRGASVWVLSNRRATSEMGQWLEDHEKQSELLGGAGKVLATHNEKYLNQTVLDLQFAHSQRSGYELGSSVLRQFSRITKLSRSVPQHASLGVLRSPDIPSILVETGFLSNAEEELKLNNPAYRRKVAQMIYEGLSAYVKRIGGLNSPSDSNDKTSTAKNTKGKESAAEKSVLKDSGVRHKVKKGESLNALANKYKVDADDIVALNKLKSRNLLLGQTLKIPQLVRQTKTETKQETEKASPKASGTVHKVKSGEGLNALARKYKVNVDDIVTLNKLKSRNLLVGQTLKIPQTAAVKKESAASNTKQAVNNKKEDKSAVKNNQENAKTVPKYHVIKKNQTLYAVSREYNIPVNTLMKLNKLADGKVQVGQRIQLK